MRSWREIPCPIQRTAMVFADVYTIMIIRDLMAGPLRFTQLAESGINPRTLTERLKLLVHNQVLVRQVYAERPPRVEYSLTEKGVALIPVLKALQAFGERWMPGPGPNVAPDLCEDELLLSPSSTPGTDGKAEARKTLPNFQNH
ncbi:transcriptional regulator [Alicyclobacillaceae bacterium I2511]|nr:transcriptional regulator [Alicyclobacillaceae bacterium I2511]